ncbi:MAG: sugar ABC transporter substrate-binding protein [Protaetiibacter sp.]
MGQQHRRTLGVLATAIGLVLAVSGCTSDGGTGGDDTIRVMLWGNDQDISSIKSAAEGFQSAHPEITIEWETGDCGVDYAACKTLAAGGTLPDAFVLGTWTYYDAVNDGLVADLTPYLEDSGTSTSDFTESVIDALTSDGDLYGLPMGYNVQSLFYNKDMFDAAGLDYPPADGSYTYDDLRAWAKQLTLDENGNNAASSSFDSDSISQYGYSNAVAQPISQGYMPVLAAFGGGVLDNGTCTVDSDETIAGFQWLQDLMWTDHSAITPQLYQEEAGGTRWVNGTVAMQFGSHEQVAAVQAQNPELNYGIAALPEGPAGNATLWQAHVWSIAESSDVKDAAWEFVHYMATDGAGTQMALIPAYQDLAEGEDFAQAPNEPANLVEAQIEPASWPLSVTNTDPSGSWGIVTSQDGIAPAIEDIILGNKTAEEALSGLCASKIDALIADAG